jgi:uncharacterized DUF497 family protein
MGFEWDAAKNRRNVKKHGVSFEEGKRAFYDEKRVVFIDTRHSSARETRYFCLGKVGSNVMTVRFLMRGSTVRIFGAGYWRKGRRIYEKENRV